MNGQKLSNWYRDEKRISLYYEKEGNVLLSAKGVNTHNQYIINHRTNDIGLVERRCSQCQEWKEENLDNFYYKNKKKPELGFTPACRGCTKKKTNIYTQAHLEEHNNKTRQWRHDHSEYMIDYNKKWRVDHEDHVKEYISKYQKDNSEKMCGYSKNHRNHDISKIEWDNCLKYFDYKCVYCGITEEEHKKKYNERLHKDHKDHNGYNDIRNAVPACKKCNSHKWQYVMEDWYKDQKFFNEERLQLINLWTTKDYKKYIEDKLPYRILRKRNEGLSTYHFELWRVDEFRNTTKCLVIKDKKKDFKEDIATLFGEDLYD